ncbi:MAG TPA: hypothetical protein ENF30_00905 [Candidatus Desulfofervidus auxilii]|uniref:Uncharacterized protein n=1 Tax=Desulfofervidus auxilii TaxID=1621989 RepID=A0A7V0I9Z0_DESA2|nr:hypothetical protein [Candidatus Desulfofervidus auxilii]
MKKLTLQTFLLEGITVIFIFSLGLFIAQKAQRIILKEEINIPTLTIGEFLFLFFFGTCLILFIVYFPKLKKIKGRIFQVVYFFSGAYGILVTLFLLFSYLPNNLLFANLLPLLFCALFIYRRAKHPTLLNHNLFIGLGLAGISAMLGLSFQPEALLILLALLSIYDFIAVYKTKHMQKMATSMLKSGTMMGLIIPNKLTNFCAPLKKVQPGKEYVILGGGDIAFPLMFSSSLISVYGITGSLVVAIFSVFGILFTLLLFLLQKERKPLPALPTISFFTVLGYLIVKFVI